MSGQERQAAAFWTVAPGKGELRPAKFHEDASGGSPAPGVEIQTLYSGVSRGSERVVFEGRVPESEFSRMRAPHQEGNFPAPVKYGYMNVGTVTRGPSELNGRTVFSLFPHQDRFSLSAEQLIAVPESVPPERAVLAAQMETALNAVWDAAPAAGERVAVVGAGVVGLLVAWQISRSKDQEVMLVDVDPGKKNAADALGLDLVEPDQARADAAGQMNIVLHASGNPAGLTLCMKLAAFEGRILELSWYGDTLVPLNLGAEFHSQRLTLQSSQVGAVSPGFREEISHRTRLEAAMSRLPDPALDVLLTGKTAFTAMPDAMPDILSGPVPELCHLIDYS